MTASNTLVVGEPRSAKSFSQLFKLVNSKFAVVVLDPQKSISFELAKRTDSSLYERIAETDRCIGFINLPASKNPNILQRMREDYDARMLIARPAMERRGLEAFTSPLIWEWSDFGLRLVQYSGAPLYWLPKTFQPYSLEFKYMLLNCTDAETKAKGIDLSFFSRTQLRNECSPAMRLWEPPCNDPCFIARCGNTDLGQLLREGRKIIFEGYWANPETVRTMFLFVMMYVISFCEKNDVPVHLVIDEASNWDLIPKDVVTALGTLQKQNLSITVIAQTIASFDETVQRMLMQNCQRREYFRCGFDMAAIAAKDICTPQLDSQKVNYYDERVRQRHEGYDGDGKAQYGEYLEAVPHYFSFGDQERLIQKDIMTLPVGVRWVNDHGQVFKEKVKFFEEPLPWNISTIRTETKIIEMRQKEPYQSVSLVEVPSDFVLSLQTSTPARSSNSKKSAGSKVIKPREGQQGNGKRNTS